MLMLINYWDTWAKDWNNGEIISSIDDDFNGVVKEATAKYCTFAGGPSSLSLDFGCGVGIYYLPSLASTSEQVLGLDISRKLIVPARSDCEARGLTNVQLKNADLGTCDIIPKLNLKNVATFAVCTNVLISPEPCTRRSSIIYNLYAVMKPGGWLIPPNPRG
jgi:2-polyprenyl-3-methyl-5-hydroxy-6-metoxy-1,4-benzoquinol methylase